MHLPEWTFDRNRFKAYFRFIVILISTLTLALTLTLQHKTVFRETNGVIFSASGQILCENVDSPCIILSKFDTFC